MSDQIIKPIELMDNDELISFLTVKKDHVVEEYREKIITELNNRGVKLEDILNVAEYKINNDSFLKIDSESAFDKISLLKNSLDVIYFKNYMADFLAVQKNNNGFVLHHHNINSGFSSFFVNEESTLKTSLKEFLFLGEWLPEGTEITKHWETFIDSTSPSNIIKLAEILDSIKVPYSVNSPMLARFNSFNAPYSIVVPVESMGDAEEALRIQEDIISDLTEKLKIAQNENNNEKQLEILTELEALAPEDAGLFFTKAQLLDKKGDFKNASDAFIEAFNLGYGDDSAEFVVTLESYLLKVIDKVEDKTNILHCLASISSFKGDTENAFNYYNKLISENENDSIAHLNLGYLYFSHTEDDDKVKIHLNKYLELEPDSPEIDSIKETLENLEY